MMMCPMGPAKSAAMLLISLGVGYLVCAKAEQKKGFLKQLGYWIGGIIIILSILVALKGVYRGIYHKMCCKGMPCSTCGTMPAK